MEPFNDETVKDQPRTAKKAKSRNIFLFLIATKTKMNETDTYQIGSVRLVLPVFRKQLRPVIIHTM